MPVIIKSSQIGVVQVWPRSATMVLAEQRAGHRIGLPIRGYTKWLRLRFAHRLSRPMGKRLSSGRRTLLERIADASFRNPRTLLPRSVHPRRNGAQNDLRRTVLGLHSDARSDRRRTVRGLHSGARNGRRPAHPGHRIHPR